MLECVQISSLEKVFSEYKKPKTEFKKASVLKNERFSYQIAYKYSSDDPKGPRGVFYDVSIKSPLKKYVTLRRIGVVPAQLTHYPDKCDDDYIFKKSGVYPDPLFPIGKKEQIKASKHLWNSIWVTVDTNGEVPAGKYSIEIIFTEGDYNTSKLIEIEIIDALLPDTDFMFTQWFHTDCIATAYNVKMFSKKHWELVEKFVKMAVRNGINMILTPVFTPPLDTQIGGERPTVQLVGVEVNDGKYKFDFTKFYQWVKMLDRCGVKYIEISHMFTQWGACAAPKVVAKVDGKMKRIFGWDTPAVGGEYEKFLDCFLPALVAEIKKLGIEDRCRFHVSDEPNQDHLENYLAAKNIVERNVDGITIMDALSSYDFYSQGVVKNPIPATNRIEPFLENKVPDLWTYYCCGQGSKTCNRFMDMPSYRNRAIGTQFYTHNIKGFLQWGYNFYYSQFSIRPIDPFSVTDADNAFPAGDAFSVYPGENGPLESLRICVFYDALQDMRAMKLLESYKGKEYVDEIVLKYWKEPVTFETYPKSNSAVLGLREEINKKIKECIKE